MNVTKEKTKFGVLEASRRVGVHRNTFTSHIKTKRVSFELDENGKKVFDAAELMRVYPDKFNSNLEEGSKSKSFATRANGGGDRETLNLKQQLDEEVAASRVKDENQIKEAKERIAFLEDALKTALGKDNKALMLLEDQSNELKNHSQEKTETIASLRSSNKKLLEREKEVRERHRERIEELQAELEKERQKSFWSKLFS